jgi:hypothetical protein
MALNQFSRRALALMILFALLAGGLAVGNQVWMFIQLEQTIGQIAAAPPETASDALEKVRSNISAVQSRQGTLYLPILGGALLLLALLFWGVVKSSARGLTTDAPLHSQKTVTEEAKKATLETPAPVQRNRALDQRLYLHLVSVLQREGRLVDFLFEDLSPYEDSQIGAAVRPIHESCNRIIRKALAPKPVMEFEEGEAVTVAAGFDPAAIKLTGNVSGAPPFKGTLRHAGWRAAKLELPTLSGTQSTRLIAPAEVELT